MPAVLTGTADVCVLVTATHHSTIAHLEKVLTPWWRPAGPTRATFTLHARLDPRAHADLTRSTPPGAHEITVTGGVAVHTTHTPRETTVLYPQLGTCVRVRHGRDPDVEIAGTSPHGVAVATALTVRDLTRSELEADQWRLYHSATVALAHDGEVPTRAWTLIKPGDDNQLWFLPHPSDTDLGLDFPHAPPAPAPADGEPQVIVGRMNDYLFTVLPDAPTTPAPQWLAVPGAFPPLTDRHDPVRGYIDDVLHADPTFQA
ncbi:hypothetical protein [Streptomyces sp. SID3343]|uniref:hypothetical protein n=1 Tax=Streptomyces sp. SID3343 TaxID=2690260 RepID=UPI00136D51AD|nr:hypothetical protein [Streptomyces sp. SID3343]MYV97651.1 hypothetical protein [Streptomyces sp. SID3343]